MKLRVEMLNLSGLDADANGEVFPIAENPDLGSQAYAIPFSQGFDETIGATDCHLNRASIASQREGGIPTSPSKFILA
jgi:hypothetical protein